MGGPHETQPVDIEVLIGCKGYLSKLPYCLQALASQDDDRFTVRILLLDAEDLPQTARQGFTNGRLRIHHEPSESPYHHSTVKHTLARRSQASHLLFLDADALVGRGFISAYRQAWREDPNAQVYALRPDQALRLPDEELAARSTALRAGINPGALRRHPLGTCQGVPREAYFAAGGFDLALHGWGAEDYLLADALILAAGCRCRYLDQVVLGLWHPSHARWLGNKVNRIIGIERLRRRFGTAQIRDAQPLLRWKPPLRTVFAALCSLARLRGAHRA